MLLERADAEVDRVVGVHHEDVGRVLGRQPVYRRELRESGEDGGFAPGDVVQPAIYGRERDGPRDFHVYLTRPAVIDDRRARGSSSRLRENWRGEKKGGEERDFHGQ